MPQTKSKKSPEVNPYIELFAKYSGTKEFFVGIRANDEGIVPVHNYSIGGVTFPVFTRSPQAVEGGHHIPGRRTTKTKGDVWLTLSSPEAGDFLDLRHDKVDKVLRNLQWHWVKWVRGWDEDSQDMVTRRASVVSLLECTMAANPDKPGQYVSSGYRWNIDEGDEPMAKYLVMIPREKMHDFGNRQDIDDLPSLADMFKELQKVPKRP